jgi:hypothetical protein
MAATTRTHYKRLIESEFLGQWDLTKTDGSMIRPTVEIESVAPYVPPVRRKKKVKYVDEKGFTREAYEDERNKRLRIRFVGKKKEWLAGPVSQKVIEGMFGPIIEDWIGKKITLYVDTEVMMGRKKTGGVRCMNRAASGPVTEDALDNVPDPAVAERIADAFDEGDDDPDRGP